MVSNLCPSLSGGAVHETAGLCERPAVAEMTISFNLIQETDGRVIWNVTVLLLSSHRNCS